MKKKKTELEIKTELRKCELANAVVIQFEEPKLIWKCSYIHYKYINVPTVDGSKRVPRKESGTFNIHSSSDQTAINAATSQLYKLLNAEPGCVIVTGAELIGTVDIEN